ncbi:MAG: dihydroorotase, partial [Flexibacteraceae bacterium]
QMHEGEQSTLLGLKGIPPLSELLAVQRDLTLLEYARGTLHLSCISTKESVEAIRNAKAKGLNVTASIAAHQLSFLDTDLAEFDTYLKVQPPFRTEEHKEALLAGLLDGTIDAVETDHTPLDTESKYLEFDLATPGIAGLQTAYPALLTATDISVEQTAQLFSYGPRAIAQLPVYEIEAGEMADLTFFHPEINTLVNTDMWSSLSNNSPFFNQKLKGAVLAVYHKGQLHMC